MSLNLHEEDVTINNLSKNDVSKDYYWSDLFLLLVSHKENDQ